jgi:hypothetical protein
MAAPPFLSAEVLLKERRVESHRLEFKAGWDDYTGPAIIKTICAFANDLPNQNGGYVIPVSRMRAAKLFCRRRV